MCGRAGIILGGPRRRARPSRLAVHPAPRIQRAEGAARHGRGLAQAPRPAQALQAAGAGRSVRSPTRRSTRSWLGSTTAPRCSWATPASARARPPEERAQEAARFRAALPASRSPWRTLATRGDGASGSGTGPAPSPWLSKRAATQEDRPSRNPRTRPGQSSEQGSNSPDRRTPGQDSRVVDESGTRNLPCNSRQSRSGLSTPRRTSDYFLFTTQPSPPKGCPPRFTHFLGLLRVTSNRTGASDRDR